MKNSQKGFIAPLLIVIAVLVIGGGVYFYKNDEVNTPISSTNADIQTDDQVQQTNNVSTNNTVNNSPTNDSLALTTNLKTYSSKYFFQFEYPTDKGLILTEEPTRGLVTITDSSQKFAVSVTASLGAFKNISDLRANVEKDIKRENEVNPTVTYKIEQTRFVNKDAISAEACIGGMCRQHIYFITDKYTYVVSLDRNQNKIVAKQISSTFKITQ